MRTSEHRIGQHPQQFIKEVEINGKIVKVPTETNNYCIYDDKVIFVLYGPEIDGRNIWCYKDDGTLLWKIQESPYWLKWLAKQSPGEKQKIFAKGHKDYYREIMYMENLDRLYVFTGRGVYRLDAKTGKVSNYVSDEGTLMSVLQFNERGLHKAFHSYIKFVKIFSELDKKENLKKKSAILKSDIIGKSAREVKKEYGLKYEPTHYIEMEAVELKEDCKFRVGEADLNHQEEGGGTLYFYDFDIEDEEEKVKGMKILIRKIKSFFRYRKKIPKGGIK